MEQNRMEQIEDEKLEKRCGGWKDKQHRRKKMQVRKLFSPEAILKQGSAGVSLSTKKEQTERMREIEREIPPVCMTPPAKKVKARHSETAAAHLDIQPRPPVFP